ncbi:hypothetical protein WS87_31875 [Burkholderia sp. MSMB0856]|nr:hypothetical protein WS87_31875 [Burkholderia sp. MSMB0856]KVH32537.1 hypothetical protein WS87_22525 [Burkholderia sp. MSMB0856]
MRAEPHGDRHLTNDTHSIAHRTVTVTANGFRQHDVDAGSGPVVGQDKRNMAREEQPARVNAWPVCFLKHREG